MKRKLLFSVQFLSEIFLIVRRNEQDVIKTVYWFQVNIRYSCQIVMKVEFSRQISKTLVSNLMKIRPVGGELFLAYGQMDRRTDKLKKLIVAFAIFEST
jgi:hypothetical protein